VSHIAASSSGANPVDSKDAMTGPVAAVQPAARTRRAGLLLRRFRRNKDGATAVEFALVATPFFMLLMAIFELAMLLWTNEIMEEAVFQSSRIILTGEAMTRYPNPATAAADFRNDVCARMRLVSNCNSRLQVDVRTFTSFANAQANKPVTGGVLNTGTFGVQPVQPNQIAVVRAVLSYPIYMSSWNRAFADLSNGQRALLATMSFRAEPFCPPATVC
jgi:Flp pilus assembly protein TadG